MGACETILYSAYINTIHLAFTMAGWTLVMLTIYQSIFLALLMGILSKCVYTAHTEVLNETPFRSKLLTR